MSAAAARPVAAPASHTPTNPIPSTDRLDSWKEIAAYLNRSTRCAQRWERFEGLPVYRHNHSHKATVYALRAEVDAWQRS